jgi:hypothetical protein
LVADIILENLRELRGMRATYEVLLDEVAKARHRLFKN